MNEFQTLYRRTAEEDLRAAKVDVFSYEKRCRPYVDMLSERREAMASGDEALFDYVFSRRYDDEKHRAHEQAAASVRELVAICVQLRIAPIYTGDLNDRQAIGAFSCMFTGESELAQFAD